MDLSPAGLISRAIVLLVAVVVHEFAHAYVAYTQGDNTAHDAGRMTLDPRANVYWPGYFIGVMFGFAVLGSAPVNAYRMRNPRVGMILAVAAGPISNLLLAAIFAVPFRFLPEFNPTFSDSIGGILPSLQRLLTDMVFLNVLLFVFNLLPLAPLDGWTIVQNILPAGPAIWWERYRQQSTYVLFGLIILSVLSGSLERISPVLGWINLMEWLVFLPASQIFLILINGA